MTETAVMYTEQRRMNLRAPQFCCFGIVDECMFHCKMCFKWQKDRNIKKMRPLSCQDWKNALLSLKKIVPRPEEFVINFGGGEALLRDDVLDLVAYASEQGFITNIASNGWLINEDLARRIAQAGLRTINLSLDSLDEWVHDDLRGTIGATKRVLRAIDYLRRYSDTLEIGICTVMYDTNSDDILPLIKWVENNEKVNWIVFMAAMQPNNTPVDDRWYEHEFRYLWPHRTQKIIWLINYIKWLKWWGWKIQNPYYQLDTFKKYYTKPDHFVKNSSCNMDRAVHISATGDIFLCFRWEKIGNIATDDIADLWGSPQAESVRKSIRTCKDNCHFLLNCFFEKDYPFAVIKNNLKKRIRK